MTSSISRFPLTNALPFYAVALHVEMRDAYTALVGQGEDALDVLLGEELRGGNDA